MSASLLTTKFYSPPIRRNFIPRPRLEMKLAESFARRLTLVSAPPGFGKTTLVAVWIEGLKEELYRSSPQLFPLPIEPPLAAWLLLDEADNEFARFFTYLVASLQQVEPNLGLGIQAQLDAPQLPPLEALITVFINDLSRMAREVVLVLDDYHLIHSETIHKTILSLIEQQPRNLHLILLTREDPPLPLSKLRVRDEITEIREQDLRFSIREATDFLTFTMGLTLSEEAITILTNRTEGWIAGLQIAGLSIQNRREAEDFIAAFRGDDRYIIDYLMEEVVCRQPQEIQDFLLQTSILKRLCAGLCDEVITTENSRHLTPAVSSQNLNRSSQEILDYLDRSNLFIIPLDNKRAWYRYHHLFADLLRFRLQRQYPEQLPELHRRAVHWYTAAGDAEEAMQHALAIPDLTLAADLAEGYLHQLIRASRITACLNWIQHLPGEAIRSRAYLCVSCAWVHILNGDFEAAGRYLEDGEAALETYTPVFSPVEQRWITPEEVCGHLSAIRAYAARLHGDLHHAIGLSQQALLDLPALAAGIRSVVALNLGIIYMAIWEPEIAWKTLLEAYEMAKVSQENLFVAVSALCQLAGIAVWQGKLREAERLCHQAIQIGTVKSGGQGRLPAVAYAHGWLAAIYNQRNEGALAQSQIEKAIELVEWVGPIATHIYARLFQARLALDAGDYLAAKACLEWAEEKSRDYPIAGPVKTEWVVNRGRLFLESNDTSAAIRWLRSQGVDSGDLPDEWYLGDASFATMRTRLPEYLLLSRVLLAQGEGAQAEILLDKICSAAEEWQYVESLLEGLALRAVVTSCRAYKVVASQGLPYLERALNLAAPEGYLRPFLVAGEPMSKLLRQAIVQGIQPDYAKKLLSCLEQKARSQAVGASAPPGAGCVASDNPGLPEPLTAREKQVLRLLAAGLNSTGVAEELVISVSTSRSYIKSLYGKLSAHSREEAVQRGMELHLL